MAGYRFVITDVLIPNRIGIAFFYHEAEQFSIKLLRLHGPNITSFQLVLGGQRWYAVVC